MCYLLKKYFLWLLRRVKNLRSTVCKHYRKCDVVYSTLQISAYRIDLMSVNGPISPKQCYYEMDYLFYSFYWLDSLEIRLDHNSTYYRSLSINSDVKPCISYCDPQNLQYKTPPEFWPSHRQIFKTSLYYKTRLILETRRYDWCCLFAKIWWWTRSRSAGDLKHHVAHVVPL